MASILYKNYLIVSYPTFDEATKTWKPQLQLTFVLDKTHSYQTKADAERAGLDAAKSVIDGLGLDLASGDGNSQHSPFARAISSLGLHDD